MLLCDRSTSASCPPLSEAELRQALEQCGSRCTKQRAAVFAYLRSVQTHPTAEQVFAAVRLQIPNISLATVYNALDALVAAQLAGRIADPTGPARYDGRSDAHYHIRCEETGQVLDLPVPFDPSLPLKLDPDLIESLRREGFEITGHRLELIGHFRTGRCGDNS
jgi:Fur family transcriptional regulator, peroxide stress response regulator